MQIDLTEPELLKLLEVQYLKGRLDELQLKAYPNILNLFAIYNYVVAL